MNNLNSLLLSYPDVAKEWHPTKNGELSVNDITAGSNKKVWWLGSCGHEWQATVTNRTNRKSGCPFCAGKKVIAGENDLARPKLLVDAKNVVMSGKLLQTGYYTVMDAKNAG